MADAPLDDLVTSLGGVGDLVAGVRRDQWDARTPCPRWNVRELVNHMVLGHRLFTGILRGEAARTPEALDPCSEDVLGEDPASAYRGAVADLLAAFREPGVLEQVFEVPAGTVPGFVAVHLRVVEDLVHGWDLARATGQRLRVPDDLVAREVAFTRSTLDDIPPEQSPFAPPQSVPDDAPSLDKLAALSGRQAHPQH